MLLLVNCIGWGRGLSVNNFVSFLRRTPSHSFKLITFLCGRRNVLVKLMYYFNAISGWLPDLWIFSHISV